LLSRLEVFPERMLENLQSSHGLVFSQAVLLSLVSAGMTRDDAYRVVQRNAMRSWDEGKDFRTLIESDPEVHAIADRLDLDSSFSLSRNLGEATRFSLEDS
jgi:adenylosuccinate lyase